MTYGATHQTPKYEFFFVYLLPPPSKKNKKEQFKHVILTEGGKPVKMANSKKKKTNPRFDDDTGYI